MISKENIINAYNRRYACKAYDPDKKISHDDFQTILETARLSPSSFGFEPWRFIVVQNPDIRTNIAQHAWGAKDKILDCSHFVLILVRQENTLHPDADYITHIMRDIHNIPEDMIEIRRGFYRHFFNHDFNLQDNPRACYDWACKQSYIALGNMLTTAAMLNIDATPIEGFALEELNTLLIKRGLWNGDVFKLSVMAAFGYRRDTPRPKTRQSMNDIALWLE